MSRSPPLSVKRPIPKPAPSSSSTARPASTGVSQPCRFDPPVPSVVATDSVATAAGATGAAARVDRGLGGRNRRGRLGRRLGRYVASGGVSGRVLIARFVTHVALRGSLLEEEH